MLSRTVRVSVRLKHSFAALLDSLKMRLGFRRTTSVIEEALLRLEAQVFPPEVACELIPVRKRRSRKTRQPKTAKGVKP